MGGLPPRRIGRIDDGLGPAGGKSFDQERRSPVVCLRRNVFSHLAVMSVSLFAVLAACSSQEAPGVPLQGEALEAQARSIDRSLMCPVCPGETIDQAQVEQARQMRQVVRDKLAEGLTRDQVLDFFADRYGEGILAAPPKGGFNLVAWTVPFGALAAGAALVYFVLRSMRRSPLAREQGSVGLEGYLELVDRELGVEDGGESSVHETPPSSTKAPKVPWEGR